MRSFLILLLFVSFSASGTEREELPEVLSKLYPGDSARLVIDDMFKELSKTHPGFYRYTTKAEYTHCIDSIKQDISDSISLMDLYRKMKVLTAKVKCLHTDLKLSPIQTNLLNKESNLIPVQLYLKGSQAFITQNFSKNRELLPSDEVLSINDLPMTEIIARLLHIIPADGFNTSLKYRAMYLQFPLWYRNAIQATNHFTIKILRNKKVHVFFVDGKKYDELAYDGFIKEPIHNKVLDFKVKNNVGILTIRSFAKTDIKRANQHFKKFIDHTFAELRKREIRNLIVDLRDNTGGTDPNAVYFTSHFFDRPFSYGNRTEVTEEIAGQIKGFYRIFYKKPLQKDSVWLWQDGKVRDLNTFAHVKNAKHHYTGRTFILINGFSMSSCANVAAILAHNKKSLFIGQETGGGYQGNNSGMLPQEVVSNTGFELTVPLQAYYLAVNPSINVGRGTPPDFSTEPTVQDLITGKDLEMQQAFLLKNSSDK